jgi:ubiquinone/menaquinone biosynthesis C-methylase UbiE
MDFAHISFLTLIELQEMRQRLALRQGAALVDLACGAGGPGLWIAKVMDATLVGVDPSAIGLTHARARADSVGIANKARFTQDTFAMTGLAEAAADGAISVDALQYAPDKRAGLKEAARILRPGGRLVFTAFEVEPQRVEGLPVLGVDPVADYRPLLEEQGFAIEFYQETRGWAERVQATYTAVIDRSYAVARRRAGQALSGAGGCSPWRVMVSCQRSLTAATLSVRSKRSCCSTTKATRTRATWRTIAASDQR